MRPSLPRLLSALLVLSALLAPRAAAAQDPEPERRQVISANPFGLLLEFFNAEYERRVAASVTTGFGGSYIDLEDENYLNLDGFLRYYPSGVPFDGWAFGMKLGLTRVAGSTYPGFGFDVNRSWLLGADGNFYVGLGFGLKRLLNVGEVDFDTRFIPTIRLVNIGFAF